MSRLAMGDRSAFDQVYSEVWPRVHGLCRRLLGDGPEADDVAQVALLKVFERASEFEIGRPALPWILGITVWECRSTLRRHQRRQESPLPELQDASCDPESLFIARDLEAALSAVIGQLKPTDQEAILALVGRGPRPALPPATFRKRLQRALERLRSSWRETHG